MFINEKRKKHLKEILKKVNINFKDFNILNQALSHRSYVNENNLKENNERLEFLGDSILGFIITEYLYKHYSNYSEGDLAKIKSFIISETSLTKIAKKIDLNKYLLIGKGEEGSGGRNKKTIIADAFEAFIAAYYIDSNLKKVKKFIVNLFANEIELVAQNKHEKDYKTLLQEYIQKEYKECPLYKMAGKEGPEHNKTFFMEVLIKNKVLGTGQGKSKKSAEKQAAKNAYLRIFSTLVETNIKSKKNI